ncbi:hypothetical protein [Streptomyces sp. NPDC001380]|uniref:hypothetical protein n=1 Tax=Streptomyces sp. NPDC001380 TaxID=3364566 RepID=UPI00368CE6A8
MPRIVFPQPGHPIPDSGLSQERCIEVLLNSSKRRNGAVPIRRSFVQPAASGNGDHTKEQSPLSKLVGARRGPDLDLYLLMSAVTTAAPFDVTERSELWARCLGHHALGASASVKISRIWGHLEDYGLITRSQNGRFTRVTKRMEDGGGGVYRPPSGLADGPLEDIYFRLPFQYWSDQLHKRLLLPGKAMLLICMSLRAPEFYITEAFAEWYGISPKTIRKGRKELLEAEILTEVGVGIYVNTWLAPLTVSAPKYAFAPPYNLNVSKRAQPPDGSAPASAETTTGEGQGVAQAPNKLLLPAVEFLTSKREAG